MNTIDYKELLEILGNGDIKLLAYKVEPYLKTGDLDARYLNALFSADESESGEDFDLRSTNELSKLATLQHAESLYKMAWKFRHGDDVDQDIQKFRSYLTAAALLGQRDAMTDLVAQIELDFGWNNFADVVDSHSNPFREKRE